MAVDVVNANFTHTDDPVWRPACRLLRDFDCTNAHLSLWLLLWAELGAPAYLKSIRLKASTCSCFRSTAASSSHLFGCVECRGCQTFKEPWSEIGWSQTRILCHSSQQDRSYRMCHFVHFNSCYIFPSSFLISNLNSILNIDFFFSCCCQKLTMKHFTWSPLLRI